MAFPGAGACFGAGCIASGPGLGPNVLGPPATGAAGRGPGCPDPASHESGASVGDGNDPAAIDPADHCATVDRNDPGGCAASGRSSKSGGAVADGALRQGSSSHQWRAGVA